MAPATKRHLSRREVAEFSSLGGVIAVESLEFRLGSSSELRMAMALAMKGSSGQHGNVHGFVGCWGEM